jgi:hypothetical protein
MINSVLLQTGRVVSSIDFDALVATLGIFALLLLIFLLLLWIIIPFVCVDALATRLHRPSLGYIILGLFVTPYMSILLLWCLGKKHEPWDD